MDIKHAIEQLRLRLNMHHMINRFVIEEKYSHRNNKEYIRVSLWMVYLRDEESEFVKLLRVVRSLIPREFRVSMRLYTDI